MLPPENVLADAEVKLIVPVPVTVIPINAVASHIKDDPASTHVPEPTLTFLLPVETTESEKPPLESVTL